MNLKEALKNKLSKKELEALRGSFDIIGDVAILEIPQELRKKEKLIAQSVLQTHAHIKTVLKKESQRKGKLRLRNFKILAGKDTETIHTEYGSRLKLDVATCYFSPRENTERQRIAEQVKPGEHVLVMFAGIGPYAFAIARRQPFVKEVVGIELNPQAFEYLAQNILLNRFQQKVIPLLGDVRDLAKVSFFSGHFDRVVMPLPKEAYKHLDVALGCLKEGGFLHFYAVEHESTHFKNPLARLAAAAKKQNRKIKVLQKRLVLPYGPRVWKICIDCQAL